MSFWDSGQNLLTFSLGAIPPDLRVIFFPLTHKNPVLAWLEQQHIFTVTHPDDIHSGKNWTDDNVHDVINTNRP